MDGVSPSSPSIRKNRHLLILIVVGLLSLMLSWSSRGFYPLFGFNDDANYYLDALHMLAGEMDSRSNFLPGQALLLLLWQRLFGPDFLMFQVGALLVNTAASVLIYLTVRDARDKICAVYVTSVFLLAPGVVLHSTTLMSEVLFGLQMWLVLYLVQISWKREDTRGYLLSALAGLVLGWSICTRSQGYFLAGGIGLAHLYCRRFKTLAILIGGTVAGVGTLYPLAYKSFQLYGNAALAAFEMSPQYLYAWALGMVDLWSNYLFELPLLGIPNRVAGLLMAVLIVIALIGFASRMKKLHLLEIVALCYFGGHIVWSFQFARYWLTFWPLLAMFHWDAYSFFRGHPKGRKFSSPLLGALIALLVLCFAVDISAVGFARRQSEIYQQRLELYQACQRVVPEQSLLATRFSAQARILSQRATIQLPPGKRFAEVVWGLANSSAEYVLVDRVSEPIVGVSGVENVVYPPGFEYRLEASQLFRQRYVDKWGSVYELIFSKADYKQACDLFVEAERQASQGETQKALVTIEACLELVRDIPEARFLRAQLLHELGRPEALNDLERLLERNPAYPELTLGLGQMLSAEGQTEKARRYYEEALNVARVENYLQVVEDATAALDSLPTGDKDGIPGKSE